VLEDYIRDKALGARTEEDYRGLLKRYWADYLDRPVTNLGPDEFLSRYREIKSPSQANHSTRIVRALYRYFNAANDDALPIPTVKALAIDGAHRLDPRQRMVARDEQAKWIGAVDAKAGPTARDLFRLLALTGLRQGEGLALTWDNIDLDRRVLTVPITKNGKPHSLPIGIRLAKLLDARRALSGEKVFSISVRNTRFSVARVVEASGVAWSCHDLRRGFATAATRLGIPDRAVKRLMNHSENDVTGKHYIWLDVEDVRPHIEAIEDHFWSMWSAPAVSEASAENGPAESPRLTARGAPVT
jgi:integrase